MKKHFTIAFCFCLFIVTGIAQVKIKDGTITGSPDQPKPNVVLELESNNKGILFPRLTSAERNVMSNPPHGVHIFNTDEKCLNYYDSLFRIWNCYCEFDTCKVITITINSGCNVNFFNQYVSNYPPNKRYRVRIEAGTVLSGCLPGEPALNFSDIPNNATVTVLNYGTIIGAGGSGGKGASIQNTVECSFSNPSQGGPGGHAIVARPGVIVSVINYGIIAGGGGGGGGGDFGTGSLLPRSGGGAGGGAGLVAGKGGNGGGTLIPGFLSGCSLNTQLAASGIDGSNNAGGAGGNGYHGGGTGGNGGGLAQAGAQAGHAGGAPGKAIYGATGNSIINAGSGQSFGAID